MKEEAYVKKYYRVSATINLDAITHNILAEKSLLPAHTKMMAVIKADGYGHGAIPVARALDAYVDAFAVAIIEEGIQLRNAGIEKPILILGYNPIDFIHEAVEYDLSQTVFQLDTAKAISKAAAHQGKCAPIHIKLDTGMGRIGFEPTKDSIQEILKINALKNIALEGIFTHFACADMSDKASANHQLQLFLDFIEELKREGVKFSICHAANSAAILDMSSASLDMVRSGISTYGIYPSDFVNKKAVLLQPALTLKTHVSFVKTKEAGYGIGYGSTFITDRPMKIATIPVGYGDGYPRELSNQGRVLIHGKSAPIIGRICMDQFMVDATHIPDVFEGDEVTLIGYDGTECIPVEEIGELSHSFSYEVLCDIGKRVPRIYYKNHVPFLVRRDDEFIK